MADFQTILDNPPIALTNATATPGTHPTVHNMGFAFNGPKPFDSAPCRYHPGTGIKMPSGTHQPYEAVAAAAALLVAHHVGNRFPKNEIQRLDYQMVFTGLTIIRLNLPHLQDSCTDIAYPESESHLADFLAALGHAASTGTRYYLAKLLGKPRGQFINL